MTFRRSIAVLALLIMSGLVFFAVSHRPTLMQPLAFVSEQLSFYIAMLSAVLAGLASWFMGLLLIRFKHLHSRFSAD